MNNPQSFKLRSKFAKWSLRNETKRMKWNCENLNLFPKTELNFTFLLMAFSSESNNPNEFQLWHPFVICFEFETTIKIKTVK